MNPVAAIFEMEVWPCAGTCTADLTNVVTLAHALALADVDAVQVCVDGGDVVPVLNEDDIAEATLPASKLDGAIAHGPDRRTRGRGEVNA